jgi:hypothetical protein
MLVAESFPSSLIKVNGKHTVYSDGGIWYHEACSYYLDLKHLLHTSFEKLSLCFIRIDSIFRCLKRLPYYEQSIIILD